MSPTFATLKKEARKIQKKHKIKYMKALEVISKEHGFKDWNDAKFKLLESRQSREDLKRKISDIFNKQPDFNSMIFKSRESVFDFMFLYEEKYYKYIQDVFSKPLYFSDEVRKVLPDNASFEVLFNACNRIKNRKMIEYFNELFPENKLSSEEIINDVNEIFYMFYLKTRGEDSSHSDPDA